MFNPTIDIKVKIINMIFYWNNYIRRNCYRFNNPTISIFNDDEMNKRK